MTVRTRIEQVMAQAAATVACSMCTRPWQRPEGMVEKRCPSCAARRGTPFRSAGEQLAADVTRYRLAIEEATRALRSGMPDAALRVLLTVEARGRAVQVGEIIGPPLRRQGNPDVQPAPQPVPVAPAVEEPTALSSSDLGDEDDPIALVACLGAGAYRR